jgi:hypothetical protein
MLNSVGTISDNLQFIRNIEFVQPDIKHVKSKTLGPIPEKALKGHAKSYYTM